MKKELAEVRGMIGKLYDAISEIHNVWESKYEKLSEDEQDEDSGLGLAERIETLSDIMEHLDSDKDELDVMIEEVEKE